MPFVAEASITIDAPVEKVFNQLADYASWSMWMPPTFSPAGSTMGKLEVGRRLQILIAHMPMKTPVEVYVVEPHSEITWGGGSKLLSARHRFLFEASGKSTVVRSVETWSGVLDRVVKPIVKRIAESVGRDQLAALKKACE